MRIAPSSGGASAAARPGRRSAGAGAARRLARDGLLGAPDRDARSLLLDRDLGDPGLLHDPHDLADPLGPRLVDAAAEQRFLAARAVADRAQERLGLVAEEREQEQLLLARGKTLRLVAHVVEVDRSLLRSVAGDERDGALDRRVDLPGRRAEAALEQVAQLVDDGLVARRREDVDDRLRGEDLADRSRDRRRAGLFADDGELVEDVVEPVGRAVRPQPRVDRGDEAGRQLVLRGPDGDAGRERRHGVFADELVDELGGLPEARRC